MPTTTPCHHKNQHHHGTLDAYLQDKCRCTPCSDANTARMREYRATTQGGLVPALPARLHILHLLASGHTRNSIATTARISHTTIHFIHTGEPNAPTRHRIRRTTEQQILKVRPR